VWDAEEEEKLLANNPHHPLFSLNKFRFAVRSIYWRIQPTDLLSLRIENHWPQQLLQSLFMCVCVSKAFSLSFYKYKRKCLREPGKRKKKIIVDEINIDATSPQLKRETYT
jgi:hypothetical protein